MMNITSTIPRLKGFRYPCEIIAYAVWAYQRFALSTTDVEDLLAERGITVSRETVRLWTNRFGRHFADCIRRGQSRPNKKWHLDEVLITIHGKKRWLWRAIDVLVQTGRNTKAVFQKLITKFGQPHIVITDQLASYIKPIKALPLRRSCAAGKTARAFNNGYNFGRRLKTLEGLTPYEFICKQ